MFMRSSVEDVTKGLYRDRMVRGRLLDKSNHKLTNSWFSEEKGDPAKGICGGINGEPLHGEPKYTGV